VDLFEGGFKTNENAEVLENSSELDTPRTTKDAH